ncbi:MAG: CARDB domain-containing protein [Spirulina sp.]
MNASFLEESAFSIQSSSLAPDSFGVNPPNQMIPEAAQKSDAPVGSTLPELELGLQMARDYLTDFASNADAIAQLELPFGQNFSTEIANNILQQFAGGNFNELPSIIVKNTAEINEANGAYDSLTGQIYLADEFVNTSSSEAIASTVLEEVGHFLDSEVNIEDAPGDEGSIFAALVQGETLSQSELSAFQSEDDTATLTLEGQETAIEQSRRPDLRMSYDSAPNSATAGSKIALRSRVYNSGNATARSSYLKYFLSDDRYLSANDTYLGRDYVKSLRSRQSSYEYESVLIPKNATSGNKYILFQADGYKQVFESNESNNISYERIYIKGNSSGDRKADLIVQNDSAPSSATAGSRITLTSFVKNIGNTTANSSRLNYYLSDDRSLSSNDIKLDSDYVRSLSSGRSSYESESVLIPQNVTSGYKYILFKADGDNKIAESNEFNNIASERIYIRGNNYKPDLIVQNDSAPNSANAGDKITLRSRVKNIGNATAGSSYLNYYLSNDNILSSDDIKLGRDYVSSLSSGRSSYESESVVIPHNVTSGYKYIFFKADGDNQVTEINGFNNIASERIYIRGQASIPSTSWKAEYFNNTNLSGSSIFIENLGNGNGFSKNWGNGGPIASLKDNYSARMTTERYLAPGLYKITTTADDGIRVKVGKQTVVNRWQLQDSITNSGFYRSRGETVPIVVEYYESGGNASLKFDIKPAQLFSDPVNTASQWKAKIYHWDSTKSNKPPSDFHHGYMKDNPNAIGAINLGSNTRSDGKKGVNFDWGQGAPKGDGNRLPHDNFAIRAYTQAQFNGGEYKFRVRGDDGFQLLAKKHGTDQWFYITPKDNWQKAYGSHKEVMYKLPSGVYDLHFHMYEGGGNAYFDLSWEEVNSQPTKPDLDIQLHYYNSFSSSAKAAIERAVKNWENIITQDKVSTGILGIAITRGYQTMAGGRWHHWAEATWTSYNNQKNQRPDLTDNHSGEVRIHFNSNKINQLSSNELTRLAMHEIGHALGLDEAQYDPSLGMDSIMDLSGLDPRITAGVYNRLEWMGYKVNRNTNINWG